MNNFHKVAEEMDTSLVVVFGLWQHCGVLTMAT